MKSTARGWTRRCIENLVEANVFLKFGLTKKAKQQLDQAVEIDEHEPRIYEKLGEIYLEEKEHASAIKAYEKARDSWQRRNDSAKAKEIEEILEELSQGKDHRADVVLEESEFDSDAISLDFVDEETSDEEKQESKVEWISSADPLQGKLAEAEYYIEQNFITAAQHLLEKLEEQYPGNKRVSALHTALDNKLKSEMDMTTIDKDLDDFFAEGAPEDVQQEAQEPASAEKPTSGPSELGDLRDMFADEIGQIGDLASKRAKEMDDSSAPSFDKLLMHQRNDEEYIRTALPRTPVNTSTWVLPTLKPSYTTKQFNR
jgi:tetratricopeptide (TPR) repeat protein